MMGDLAHPAKHCDIRYLCLLCGSHTSSPAESYNGTKHCHDSRQIKTSPHRLMSIANNCIVCKYCRFTLLLGHLICHVSLLKLLMAQVGGLNTQHDVNMTHYSLTYSKL